jgi:hypothetical protein
VFAARRHGVRSSLNPASEATIADVRQQTQRGLAV